MINHLSSFYAHTVATASDQPSLTEPYVIYRAFAADTQQEIM